MNRTPMTTSHKQALAEGRAHSRAVAVYLDALRTQRRKRGRPVTIESLRARLQSTTDALAAAVGVERLNLVQRRIDLEARIAVVEGNTGTSLVEAQEAFVLHAKAYSDAKGISVAAWRELGVPANVLREAGIK